MSEHTPTPWHADDTAIFGEVGIIARIPNHPENGKNWKIDADRIVKAVNAHDRLVEALEFIRDGYDNHDVNHVDYRVKVYQVALDVLAAVSSPSGSGK